MSRKSRGKTSVEGLRKRAETILAAGADDVSPGLVVDAQRFIQELQLYQIELNIQNDDLRQVQEDLEAARSKYADLFEAAPIGYVILSAEGIIDEINAAGATLLGRGQKWLAGRSFSRFIAEPDRAAFLACRRRLTRPGQQERCELTLQPDEGQPVTVMVSASGIFDDDRQLRQYRLALTDITRRKEAEAALQEANCQLKESLAELQRMQDQLIYQERLAAVGQLAGGLAHDFNNILTAIIGSANFLEMEPDLSPTAQADLDKIISNSHRAREMVRRLTDFTRQAVRQPRALELAPFLQQSLNLITRSLPDNIEVRLEIVPAAYQIEGDPNQLQEVLTHLVHNAVAVLPDGGTLRFDLSPLTLTPADKPCPCPELSPGDWACLTVADDGPGIPSDVLPYIFEPFFTTKPVGEGSGLGLAQVYGLVKQHGGCLTVTSEVRQGTTFTIYLPTQ